MSIPIRGSLSLEESLDLNQHDLLRLCLENLSAAPSGPEIGRTYFDTTLSVPRTWDGTQWIDLFHLNPAWGSVTAQTAFGAASGNGSSTTFSRSDHTHGTPTHNDAAHSAIHLSALAAPTASVDCGGQRFTNAADPVDDSDLATKGYVTYNSYGLLPHQSVSLVLNEGDGFLFTSTAPAGEITIDEITTSQSRVLVAYASDPSSIYNGIWKTDTGSWAREADADASGEIEKGTAVYVSNGKLHTGELWACYATTDDATWVPDTKSAYFTQFASLYTTQAGVGLSRSGNTLNVLAGNGIDVSGGSVAVDAALVPRKLAATIGDGTATTFTIDCTTIGGAEDVIVQTYDIATGLQSLCQITRGAQNVTITFDAEDVPAADSVRVVIHQ